MANGLIGMQQSEGQRQGNLLGGIFQSPSNIRQQGRNRIVGDALAISQSADPVSASLAVGGANLGLGIGNALGFQTQEQRTAGIVEQVQRESLERGLTTDVDPVQTLNFAAQRFQELGAPDLAMQALSQREQFATEPQVGDPQTYYGPNGEQVEATPVVLDDGRTLLRTLNGQLLNGLNFTSEERLQNTPVKAKDIPARFPDGTTGTAYNVPGMIGLQIVNDQGEYEPAPRGTTELTSATQTPQRTRGSTDQDWTTQVNVTQELVDTSSRIKSILDEEGANVIGFLGSTNRFFASLGAQSKALLQQATVFDEETGQNLELDIENFRESFPASLADQSQRIQTNALRLAYLVAKSSDPSGRVSDADFRAALQRIGGSTGNPSAFVAALQEETRNAVLSAARNSENFLEEGVNPSQFVNQFLEGRFVNTDILSGMDFLQSDSGNGQNGAPEEVSMEEVINNATETKVLQGTTYYKYQGDWYGE